MSTKKEEDVTFYRFGEEAERKYLHLFKLHVDETGDFFV